MVKQKNIDVSVILPCYNQAQFLDETLQSVFNQSVSNWECIIIDDGSTDHSAQIAKQWVEKDTRFQYHYKRNGGLSSARNFGLQKASGTYIQLLDSDDILELKKFEKQLKDLEVAPISICDYTPFDHVTGKFNEGRYLSPFLDQTDYKREIVSEWEYRKSIPCHTVLFERSLIEAHRLSFKESLDNHEDWVFWVQLFYFADGISNRNEKLARYRIHNRSMSVDFVAMKKGFLQAATILQEFFRVQNDETLFLITKNKYKEIKSKGVTPLYLKIYKRLIARLFRNYKNVR